jgi:hypothetical protein
VDDPIDADDLGAMPAEEVVRSADRALARVAFRRGSPVEVEAVRGA